MDFALLKKFSKEWYESVLTSKSGVVLRWLGNQLLKNPCDLFVIQEILYDTRPDLIIECGTYKGGSALYYSSICSLLNLPTKIVSIDIVNRIEKEVQSQYDFARNIQFIQGSSIDIKVFKEIQTISKQFNRVMVILDSDHSYNHVLQELNLYASIVSEGMYLICEDSTCDLYLDFKDGPHAAIKEFLKSHQDFQIDKSREYLQFTCNPDGFLLKYKKKELSV